MLQNEECIVEWLDYFYFKSKYDFRCWFDNRNIIFKTIDVRMNRAWIVKVKILLGRIFKIWNQAVTRLFMFDVF